MANWEEFEKQCEDYLNDKFGHYADFTLQGGADSTVPDILVTTQSGKSFYIEVKHSPAQCGQFVLFPDLQTRTFEYSEQNVNKINCYAELIMDYMNQDFDAFRDAGTAGKDIDMSNGSNVFANWVIQAYHDKGADFFVTNNFTLLPIDRFSNYFDVAAKYRIKRSGSGNVGRSRFNSVLNYITSNGYTIKKHRIVGDKLFISSPVNLHNQRFIINGTEYMFSLREDEYELRKLSNTYNANVIFSIKQKTGIPGMSAEEFINYLK